MGFSASDLTLEMGVRVVGADFAKRAPLQAVDSRGGGWFPLIREPYAGAWQRNDEWTVDSVLAHPTVYSCVTIIANDIGKLRPKLMEQDADGIWSETTSPSFSPFLRRPNRFQNHIQFVQWWVMSKLLRGNTYALKQRDNRGVVVAAYILDASRVTPLVAPDGSVFYQINTDNLAGVQEEITAPASEVFHDRMNCLFHPLVGIAPLFACGVSANIGLEIQSNSTSFFGNGSNPGGVLTAPGAIGQDTADRLKEVWDTKFGGANSGKIAVLGDGLTFEPMRMSATDSQLIETLKWSDEKICSVFHVPAYKVGVGPPPAYNNIGALATEYYSTCLQTLIEEYEACLDEGLGIDERNNGKQYGVELDLKGLLRMDPMAQMDVAVKGVQGGITFTNEGRADLNLKPVAGGNVIFRQQQDFPLSVLAGRDSPDKPIVAPAIEPAAPVPEDDAAKRLLIALTKRFEEA
jgi:HK97 family phage portal protein